MGGGRRMLRVLDRDYPHALRELPSPPDPVWIEGELLAGPAVAIVGTRKPSEDGAEYARHLAGWLARAGIAVWSGGAFGIDAAAHRGALDAGGITVAVVGTGLEHCYPAEHAPLYRCIVNGGGALVSPFEPDQHATLTTFPQRNALLAAMTAITVVVQSPIKSGARSTARWARRLGRPLFAVPQPPWDELGQGNCAELRLGAMPLVHGQQLLEWLHRQPWSSGRARQPAFRRPGPPRAPLLSGSTNGAPSAIAPTQSSPAREAVLRAASGTPRHIDDFCLRTGFPTGLVQEALLTLTLEAVLVEGPAGWFRSSNCSEYLDFGLQERREPVLGSKKG
jgi:DNA processing protein